MYPVLLVLAALGQAPTPMAAPAPHWFAIDRPNGSHTYLWGIKDGRGAIRGVIYPPGSPELASVPRPVPRLIAQNFGLDMSHLKAAPGQVRGTDAALGRELLERSLFPATGQRPCPGPGPCPSPPRKPDPAPPPLPAPPGVDPMPLAFAAGFGVLTLGVCAVFLLVLLMKGRRP